MVHDFEGKRYFQIWHSTEVAKDLQFPAKVSGLYLSKTEFCICSKCTTRRSTSDDLAECDTIGVRQSRWTRLVTGLLKAWPPNPVCQFGAGRINYHTNPLPFNQIVIIQTTQTIHTNQKQSHQPNQTYWTKLNLPNKTYQSKPLTPNLPNQINFS